MASSQTRWDANPAPGYKSHPDHEVVCAPFDGTVRISFDGTDIAVSNEAFLVQETNHRAVYYLPVKDIMTSHLIPSAHVTRCPFKGKASYWNLKVGDHEIDNAVWSYEMPYDEALELAGLMAFYESKVTIETNAHS